MVGASCAAVAAASAHVDLVRSAKARNALLGLGIGHLGKRGRRRCAITSGCNPTPPTKPPIPPSTVERTRSAQGAPRNTKRAHGIAHDVGARQAHIDQRDAAGHDGAGIAG